MKMLEEGDYGAMVMEKGRYFLEGLRELQRRWPQIGDVDGLGLALRCEICESDGFTPNKALLDHMVEEGLKGDLEDGGRKLGLVLDVGGYHKNVITLAPSLEISYAQIDLSLRLLDALLRRCV
jgi:4-aminobutyrate aminotransferase-like enzyme